MIKEGETLKLNKSFSFITLAMRKHIASAPATIVRYVVTHSHVVVKTIQEVGQLSRLELNRITVCLL